MNFNQHWWAKNPPKQNKEESSMKLRKLVPVLACVLVVVLATFTFAQTLIPQKPDEVVAESKTTVELPTPVLQTPTTTPAEVEQPTPIAAKVEEKKGEVLKNRFIPSSNIDEGNSDLSLMLLLLLCLGVTLYMVARQMSNKVNGPVSISDELRKTPDLPIKKRGSTGVVVFASFLVWGLNSTQTEAAPAKTPAPCKVVAVLSGKTVYWGDEKPVSGSILTSGSCPNVTGIDAGPGVIFTDVKPRGRLITFKMSADNTPKVGQLAFNLINNGELVESGKAYFQVYDKQAAAVRVEALGMFAKNSNEIKALDARLKRLETVERTPQKTEVPSTPKTEEIADAPVGSNVEKQLAALHQKNLLLGRELAALRLKSEENTELIGRLSLLQTMLAQRSISKGGIKGLLGIRETFDVGAVIKLEDFRKLMAKNAAAEKKRVLEARGEPVNPN